MQNIELICTLNVSFFLGLLSKQDSESMAPTFKPLTQKERLEIVWKMSPPERLAELQLTPETLEHWVEVSVSLMRCGKGYSPAGTARESFIY
jgi:hypothetical protein